MRSFLVFLSILFYASLIQAQPGGVFKSFKVIPLQNSVRLEWTVFAGNSCPDVQIQRSSDGINFDTIYSYPGVCGSPDEDQEYSWTDINPLRNVTAYYKLRSGFFDASKIEIMPIKFLEEGKKYTLFPNPVTGTSSLLFENSSRKNSTLTVFDLQGNKVLQTEPTSGNEFFIIADHFRDGIYFFVIQNQTERIAIGKLIVLH